MKLTVRQARRLAVTRQRLDGTPRPRGIEGMRDVLRSLRCLQLDPVSTVAPSHNLVLWSRLGRFDPADLDALLWGERWLFEYWAHAASMVLTDDLPIHAASMLRLREPGGTGWNGRLRQWQDGNAPLEAHILERLRADGPLPAAAFTDATVVPWESGGWTSGRSVGAMLDQLWTQGYVLVAGRKGRRRLWDLAERCLPAWADAPPLSDADAVRASAEHALRALGVARRRDIEQHFVRNRYPGLPGVLDDLLRAGRVLTAQLGDDPEPWYLHVDALADAERAAGDWQGRTVLLSPFDNLICDRARTERLWGVEFRNEMYTPKAKRRYGHYVLAILHGEQIIGRVAPLMDRRTATLALEGVYAEPGAPGKAAGKAVAGAIEDLATCLGAERVTVDGPVPDAWRRSL